MAAEKLTEREKAMIFGRLHELEEKTKQLTMHLSILARDFIEKNNLLTTLFIHQKGLTDLLIQKDYVTQKEVDEIFIKTRDEKVQLKGKDGEPLIKESDLDKPSDFALGKQEEKEDRPGLELPETQENKNG